MSEEAPAVEQDQPTTTEAPETDQPTSEESFTDFDSSQIPEDADRSWFEDRVKNFQADYTRKTQGLSEQRQEIAQSAQHELVEALRADPSLLRQFELDSNAVLDALGYQTEPDDDEFIDPTERELQEIKAWKASIEQGNEEHAQYEAEADFVEEELQKLEQQTGQSYDEDEANWIFDIARSRRTQRGLPDVKAAVSLLDNAGKKRVETFKKAKNAPRTPGQGRAGSKAVDLTNKAAREERMAEVAQAALSSQDAA